MTIPAQLQELREVNSCDAANQLLASGWVLVSSEVNLQATPWTSYFLLGRCASAKLSPSISAERYSGNLAADARM
jgi:hypothetical protein